MKSALDENDASKHHHSVSAFRNGACHDRIRYYSPDRSGDANSTEMLDFYDPGCRHVERDRVRVYTVGRKGTETVKSRIEYYDRDGTRMAVRTEVAHISQATFVKDGYPDLGAGFVRQSHGTLAVDGSNARASWGSEFIVDNSPSESGIVFCMDSAGFENAASTTATSYGFEGGTMGDSQAGISQNPDGTVTYSATHRGYTHHAAYGGLSITRGRANVTCPIVNPAFGIMGSPATGHYRIPLEATFDDYHVRSVIVNGGGIGDLGLTVHTVSAPDARPRFDGTFQENGKTVGSFEFDEIGRGTLTVGKDQYRILDWSVIR